MRKYEKYKDSGIAWIGEIPDNWEVFPIKHLCRNEKYSIKTGPFGTQLKGDDLQESGDVRVYNQKNVIYGCFDDVRFYVSDQKAEGLKSFYTQPNDFLITSRGTIGRAAIIPNDLEMGILHPCLIALRLSKYKILDKWLLYFVNDTDCFKTGIQLASNATTIEVIYTETLKNTPVAIPSIPEQEQIAKYLDWKCGEVDRIVDVRERQIKLLGELRTSVISRAVTRGLDPNAPLKDSGIEWIGQIPEHWEVSPLKYLVECNKYSLGEKEEESKIIDYVEISDVNHIDGIISHTKYLFKDAPSRARRITDVNDVIVSTVRTYLGAITIVKEKGLIASTGFAVLTPKRILHSYLGYTAVTERFIDETVANSTGVSYPAITSTQLIKIYVPSPPLPEQQQIADYLDKKTAEIDSTIEKFKAQIDKIKEYRQALITEVVTGKIDVRGIEIPASKSN